MDLIKEVRRAVAKRDKYKCVYCMRHISELKALGIKCQIDHVIPVARGGSNAMHNLAFSCEACNNKKSYEIWSKGNAVDK